MGEEDREGWAKPELSRKWHYFHGARSLCGSWALWAATLHQGNDNSPDNCMGCRKRMAQIAKLAVTG